MGRMPDTQQTSLAAVQKENAASVAKAPPRECPAGIDSASDPLLIILMAVSSHLDSAQFHSLVWCLESGKIGQEGVEQGGHVGGDAYEFSASKVTGNPVVGDKESLCQHACGHSVSATEHPM